MDLRDVGKGKGKVYMTQIDGKIVGSFISKRDTILLQHSQGEAAVKTTWMDKS